MSARSIQEKTITKQLRIVLKALQTHSRSVEKVCGLSSAQLWMLYEVSRSKGMKVTELATKLTIHPSTSSNMLDKLEKKNLIYRDRSKSDQRSVHIYIAEQGKELLTLAPPPQQGLFKSALTKLSDEQVTDLETSLHVFIDALHFGDMKKQSRQRS